MADIKWTWQQAILDSDLPATTRHILLTIGCYMNMMGEGAYPSIRTLEQKTGWSAKTVVDHIKIAAERGWIKVGRHGFGGTKWRRNEYIACWPERGAAPRGEQMLPGEGDAGTGGGGVIPKDTHSSGGKKTAENKAISGAVEPATTPFNPQPERVLNLPPKGVEPDGKRVLKEVQRITPVNSPGEISTRTHARGVGGFDFSEIGSGEFRIQRFLTETVVDAAKRRAPGWDIYHLAGIYNGNINDGRQERPKYPAKAFPAWCGCYTKGEPPR